MVHRIMMRLEKLVSFRNWQDDNYRGILLFSIISGVLMQSLILPSLDYLTLDIKNNANAFYNLATVATIAASLPYAISFIISYFVNNLTFKRVFYIGFSLLVVSSIFIFYYNSIKIYVLWIVLCGIVFNAISLNFTRQICYLLSDKIKDYQSDLFLFVSLGNILGYKSGNMIYNHWHLRGIILSFFIALIGIFFIIKNIKFNQVIERADTLQPSIGKSIMTMIKHRQLITFLMLIFSIIFLGSGFNLFALSKIHKLQLSNIAYAHMSIILTIGGFAGALLIKNPTIQKFSSDKSIILAVLSIMTAYLVSSVTSVIALLAVVIFIFGFANVFFLVNMNTICYRFMNADKELLSIAPMISGFMMTGFYSLSLLGPFIYRLLFKAGFSLSSLLIIIASLQMIIVIILHSSIKFRERHKLKLLENQ